VTTLDERLAELQQSGRKALVPYFVAGLADDWLDCVRAAVHAGADVVEIGVPFSDPMIDGVVIQQASNAALARGTTLASVLDDLSRLDVDVPLVAMTYFNIFHHRGLDRCAAELHAAGVSGTIVPDLSLEEVGPWREAANGCDVASVLMVAPSTPSDRVASVCASSQGFVYAAARMAVTGAATDAGDATRVVESIRQHCSKPVYVGIGITTPAQARDAVVAADGVIVGTALVRRLLDGQGPRGVEEFVGALRAATS
jgi:tryptophan synthase alpha chain